MGRAHIMIDGIEICIECFMHAALRGACQAKPQIWGCAWPSGPPGTRCLGNAASVDCHSPYYELPYALRLPWLPACERAVCMPACAQIVISQGQARVRHRGRCDGEVQVQVEWPEWSGVEWSEEWSGVCHTCVVLRHAQASSHQCTPGTRHRERGVGVGVGVAPLASLPQSSLGLLWTPAGLQAHTAASHSGRGAGAEAGRLAGWQAGPQVGASRRRRPAAVLIEPKHGAGMCGLAWSARCGCWPLVNFATEAVAGLRALRQPRLGVLVAGRVHAGRGSVSGSGHGLRRLGPAPWSKQPSRIARRLTDPPYWLLCLHRGCWWSSRVPGGPFELAHLCLAWPQPHAHSHAGCARADAAQSAALSPCMQVRARTGRLARCMHHARCRPASQLPSPPAMLVLHAQVTSCMPRHPCCALCT